MKFVPKEDFDECTYHDCTEKPSYLWHGYEAQDGVTMLFTAVYCHKHSQGHAELQDDMRYIGRIEDESVQLNQETPR